MAELVVSLVASKLEGEQRINAMPTVLGDYFFMFEPILYSVAKKVLNGYSGGYWDIYGVADDEKQLKSAFFALADTDVCEVESLGFQRTVATTGVAAGVALTLIALSNLSFAFDGQGNKEAAIKAADAFHALRAFAFDGDFFNDDEKNSIYVIID